MSSPADPTRRARAALLAGLSLVALGLMTLQAPVANAGAVAAPLQLPASAGDPGALPMRVAAAGKAAAATAAAPTPQAASAAGRGRIDADDDDTAGPASGVPGAAPAARTAGGYRLRCWQYGQLLFDEGPVVLPADAKRNARVAATDRRGNLVLVSDVGGGTTCLTAQRWSAWRSPRKPAVPTRRDALQWLATATTAAACAGLAPSSPRAAGALAAGERRPVDGADAIVIGLPCTLVLNPGQPDALQIDAEPEALRRIVTRQDGRRLTVDVDGRLETSVPIRLQLSLRALRSLALRAPCDAMIGALQTDRFALSLEGGGTLQLASLQAVQFELSLRGAGRVTVDAGRVQRQRIGIQGDGHYDALALDCEEAEVSIAGQGELRLAAARRLGVQVAGMGRVRYRGRPEVVRSIQGVGSVEPA